MHKFDMLN